MNLTKYNFIGQCDLGCRVLMLPCWENKHNQQLVVSSAFKVVFP